MANSVEQKPEEEGLAQSGAWEPIYEDICQRFDNRLYIFVESIQGNRLIAGAVVTDMARFSAGLEEFWGVIGYQVEHVDVNEITMRSLGSLMHSSESNNFGMDHSIVFDKFGLGELRIRRSYGQNKRKEFLVGTRKTHRELFEEAGHMLCGHSLQEELLRIREGTETPQVQGHPVHYIVQMSRTKDRTRVIETLMSSLFQAGRLKSRRYTIQEAEPDEVNTLNALYQASHGGSIVLTYPYEDDMDALYAQEALGKLELIGELIVEYQHSVLTVFCIPKAGDNIKRKLKDHCPSVSYVAIAEQRMREDEAEQYLDSLAMASGVCESVRHLLCDVREKHAGYSPDAILAVFQDWLNRHLKTAVYPQYEEMILTKRKVVMEQPKGNAYDELQAMIGIGQVKQLISRAMNYYHAQRLYVSKGIQVMKPTMHMVFTGNPGTAKTSVARLYARIMHDNGMLSTGNFVEVGRAELVGKYVGWTAKAVKKAFEKAKGGVLFIDEAYSLVDDREGMYGDEAINTIVMEMENNRQDIMVIFAGYPDKMNALLQRNEGLRSRVAFHVPFPDYTVEELYGILNKMVSESGMQLAPGAERSLMEMFEAAIAIPDFGNGRFVRNLLEGARMKQANRLMKNSDKQLTTRQIKTLRADDFRSVLQPNTRAQRMIGFGAS